MAGRPHPLRVAGPWYEGGIRLSRRGDLEAEARREAAPRLFAGGLYRFVQPIARFVFALFAAESVSITGPACAC